MTSLIGYVLGAICQFPDPVRLRSAGFRFISLAAELANHADELRNAGLEILQVDAPDAESAFQAAKKTEAKLVCVPLDSLNGAARLYVSEARTLGLVPLVTAPKLNGQKFQRILNQTEGLFANIDIGQRHAQGHALEDFWLLRDKLGSLYLSDSSGEAPGVMESLQPGYGSVPWKALGRALKSMPSPPPLYINAPPFPYGNHGKSMEEVFAECLAVLEGRVHISPAGGFIGKDPDGRIMML